MLVVALQAALEETASSFDESLCRVSHEVVSQQDASAPLPLGLTIENTEREALATADDVTAHRPDEELSFELLETTRANFDMGSQFLQRQPSGEEEDEARKPFQAEEKAFAKAIIEAVANASDVDTSSSESESDDDSDESDDFYVVPIPDCFIPALPNARTASTSVYVNKGMFFTVSTLLSPTLLSKI